MATRAPPQLSMPQHSAPATQQDASGLQRAHACGALFSCTHLNSKRINAFSSFCAKALLTLGGFLKANLFIDDPIPNTGGKLHTAPSNMYALVLHNMDEIFLPTAALVSLDCARPEVQRDASRASILAVHTLETQLENKGGTCCATDPQHSDAFLLTNHGNIASVKMDGMQGVGVSDRCINFDSGKAMPQEPSTSTTGSLHDSSRAPAMTTAGSVKGLAKSVAHPRFKWNVNAAEFFPSGVKIGTTALKRSSAQFRWNVEAAPFVLAGYDKRTASTDISATLVPPADGALSAWNDPSDARPVSRRCVSKFCASKKLSGLEASCISGQSGNFPQRDRPSPQRDCGGVQPAWHEARALIPRAGDI